MAEQEKNNEQQIQINFTDDLFQGRYANQMMVRHTPEEFILDFFNFFPGDNRANVTARIIMAPGHVKRMLAALQENLKKYEESLGVNIKASEQLEKSFGFDTQKAE